MGACCTNAKWGAPVVGNPAEPDIVRMRGLALTKVAASYIKEYAPGLPILHNIRMRINDSECSSGDWKAFSICLKQIGPGESVVLRFSRAD